MEQPQCSIIESEYPTKESYRNKFLGSETRHPIYRGVRKRRWGKWVSKIREPKKKNRIWLGSFQVPEMAARAYDVAAYCLKGRKAQLNFPKEIDFLPRPNSCDPRDIQAAATKAAQMVAQGKFSEITKSNRNNNDNGIDDFWEEIDLPELIVDNWKNNINNSGENCVHFVECCNLVSIMCNLNSSIPSTCCGELI